MFKKLSTVLLFFFYINVNKVYNKCIPAQTFHQEVDVSVGDSVGWHFQNPTAWQGVQWVLGLCGEQINFVGFGCVILFPLNNNMIKEPVKES